MSKVPARAASDTKRRHILAVATELFLERGFSGASTTELLRRTGGSKTTIYAYFGDKAGLFTAVIDEMLLDSVSLLKSLDLAELPIRDALVKIAGQYLKVVLSRRYLGLMRIVVAEVNRFPEIGEAFYARGPGLSYERFRTFLDERTVNGELVIADTSRATDLFFGTLLHRELLERLYGVKSAPLRNVSAVASAVADEFIERYGVKPHSPRDS
jgi:AcrR family transcriptional regulator